MNRSLSHARNLEASNVPTSEKDAQLLLSILQAHSRPVPYLEDESEPTPLPDDPAFQKFANLNAGRRECVRALIENIMDGAARRVAEQGLITEDSNEPPVSEQTLQLPAPNDKIVESPPNSDIASTG